MTYDTEQMIFVGVSTPEESAAVALHYEITAAARSATDSLLALGRKLKEMRDTNGYKALGFETLGDYTQAAVGLNQRQAYNYIAVVEKLPAKLVEQNAAAGVTKLALLAQLTEGEQREIVAETDLQSVTVKQLQTKIRELEDKNSGYAEQLSILQSNAADVPLQEDRSAEIEALQNKLREAEDKLKAAADTADRAEKKAAKLKDKIANEKAQAEVLLEKARRDGAEEAKKAAAEAARQAAEKELEAAQAARQAAEARAEELAKKLKVAGDDDTMRFSLLFDRVQTDVDEVLALCDEIRRNGKDDKAEKFKAALRKALGAISEQI